MFFLCLTHGPCKMIPRGLTVRSVPLPAGVVTVGVDDTLARMRISASEIMAWEGLPTAAADRQTILTQARFDIAALTLEFQRSTNSGRAIYYHTAADGSFYCASHLRMLQQLGVKIEDDSDALGELFLYRMIAAPRTLAKGVRVAVAGEQLAVDLKDGRWRVRSVSRYMPPVQDRSLQTQTSADAVQARLRAIIGDIGAKPEDLAIPLSGGLDSSLLFKIAGDSRGVVDSYATAYPFEPADTDRERAYSHTAADAFGAHHHFFQATTNEYLHGFIDAIYAAEEPLVHLQTVMFLLLFSRGLHPDARTIVSGEGADGIWGMKIQYVVHKMRPWRAFTAPLGMPPIWGILRTVSRRANRWGMITDILNRKMGAGVPLEDPRHVLWSLGTFGDVEWIKSRIGCSRAKMVEGRAAAMSLYRDRDVLDLFSLASFFTECALTQLIWSKLAEAAGKSMSFPFNDQQIMDHAFRVPWGAKFASPKHVLRQVARDIGIPEFIITRPKSGFGVMPTEWALPGTALDPLVALAAKAVPVEWLRELQSAEVLRAQTFWSALNLGIWRRLFVQGDTPQTLHAELDAALGSEQPTIAQAALVG